MGVQGEHVDIPQQAFTAKGWYDAKIDGEYGPRSHVGATRYRDEAS